MKLTIDYGVLLDSTKILVNTLKRATNVTMADKNIAFKVEKSGLTLYAFTPSVVVRTFIESGSYEVAGISEEVEYFQVPSQMLERLLSTYAPSSLSKPIELVFENVTSNHVVITMVEEVTVPEQDPVIRESPLSLTVAPFSATALERLSMVRKADEEGVEFNTLDEDSLVSLTDMVTDMTPYVGNLDNASSSLHFKEGGTVEALSATAFAIMANNVNHFLAEGGIRPLGLSVLKDILDAGSFSFVRDEEIGSLVFKQGQTVIGVLYDKGLVRPNNPLDGLKDISFLRVSRPLLEMYYSRMKNLSTSGESAQVRMTVSEDLSTLAFQCNELKMELGVDEAHQGEGEDAVPLAGYTFSLPLIGFPSILFGKQAYADDIVLSLAHTDVGAYVEASDSSRLWKVIRSVG